MNELLCFIFGFIIGGFTCLAIMCCLQVSKTGEIEKGYSKK